MVADKVLWLPGLSSNMLKNVAEGTHYFLRLLRRQCIRLLIFEHLVNFWQFIARCSGGAEGHEPNNTALGDSSPQRQIPARPRSDVQSVHPRLDQLLRLFLSHAVASDPDED